MLLKKLLLKTSGNCQENTSSGTSFWIKIGLLKRTFWHRFFPANFEKHLQEHQFGFTLFWSSRSQNFFKIGIFKNSEIFTEKLLVIFEFLFNKVAGLKANNLIQKNSNTGVFLWILTNFYYYKFFIEHLWWLLLIKYSLWPFAVLNFKSKSV